jgi:predicted nuclease with RNAse H fold
MQKVYKVLGIDLGGCMSGNSAYIYAEVIDGKIEVLEAFKEPKHKEHTACQNYIVDLFERLDVDAIAIDAPLSLPLPLISPQTLSAARKGSGEILNPYLFRYTDYFLYATFGLRPMPPAGDRIGRLTARAIALLHHFEYQFPNLTIHGKKIPIYEVYPKQIAHALGFENYKKEPGALLRRFNQKGDLDEHLVDALLCVYGGSKILRGDCIGIVDEAKEEGWCFPVIE